MSNNGAANGSKETAGVLFLFAETPIHAGTGAVKAAVDLPIQRSVQTQWPVIYDSSMRGGLREAVREIAGKDKAAELFGHEPVGEADLELESGPGKLITPDAEMLLFPVASTRNTMAWVTCIPALQSLLRRIMVFHDQLGDKARKAVEALGAALKTLSEPGKREAVVSNESAVLWEGNKLILASDSFAVKDKSATDFGKWLADYVVPFDKYWGDRVAKHLVVVDVAAFEHYALTKTDIRPRVKLDAGKVAEGALWTEESLPVDSVLYQSIGLRRETSASIFADFASILNLSGKPVIQLGGDQSLGRGFVRLRKLGD